MKRHMSLLTVILMIGIWSCSKNVHQVQTGNVAANAITAIQNNYPATESYENDEGRDQEPAWTYFERLSLAFDGDSTCIGMKADMDYPEWYSGCFFNDKNRLTINVIGDTVEIRNMLNDLLRGNEFDLGMGVCNKTTQQQTKRLLHEAIARSETQQDLGISSEVDGTIEITLTGDSIEATNKFRREVFDSPILRFRIVESIHIILL